MTNDQPEKKALARAGNMDYCPNCNSVRYPIPNAGVVAVMGMGSL